MSFIQAYTGELPDDISSAPKLLEIIQTGFKEMRDSAGANFANSGMQPNTEPSQKPLSLEEELRLKQKNYKWQIRPDFVPQVTPPATRPPGPQKDILDPKRVIAQEQIPQFIQQLVPQFEISPTMADLEADNDNKHKDQLSGDFYDEPNVGLRDDWYTDACFGQQQFTGVNPTTITILTDSTVFDHFISTAVSQGNKAVEKLIRSSYTAKELYVQDCRYYREAVGLKPDQQIRSNVVPPIPGLYRGHRYGAASVVLFTLTSSGKLHPLAITLDYKGTASSRVTIFNKRLSPKDTSVDEKNDWPWRYAKTCAQASDWSRHEMTVHLTNTHLIEEAVIVAAQRNFSDSHVILQVMNSHWTTTLALNSLAREKLVPQLIGPVCPFDPAQTVAFIRHARKTFDFVGSYIPADLEKRGFPISELEKPTGKFHNYTYARQIYKMWTVIHEYVSSVMNKHYANDEAVRADKSLAAFVKEIKAGDGVNSNQPGGNLPQFPVIDTRAKLIDMVTMCIHIAAPQHTAVNYLQQYYLAFIPNRPGSLYTPIPYTIDELKSYGERELIDSLPLVDPSKWLMMAQVPYLLSKEVEASENIINYANTVASHKNPIIASAGKVLQKRIEELDPIFKQMSKENDEVLKTEYKVMYPNKMASAIVI